jgi:DUF1680 family protein
MDKASNRRDFMKIMLSASVAPSLLRRAEAASPAGADANLPPPKIFLEPFNYEGVRLLDSRFRKQYLATRDYYYNIPNDDILKGFRKAAGLPAPGEDMGGWCAKDPSVAFGQWLSGMARMYKATGDRAMRDKATQLMLEWGKTIVRPELTHYTYEKTLCGLVDLYAYGGQKEALPLLEQITDWASQNLSRARKPASLEDAQGGYHTGDLEWYTLSENLYRAYQLTGNPKYKTFGDVWRYPHYWGMFAGERPVEVRAFHAYSHVNTLSSAAMAYAITGDPQYLKTIVNAYDYFQQTQCYATGGYGPGEALVAPDGSLGKWLETEPTEPHYVDQLLQYFVGRSFETPCGSWAVFKLGRYLMQYTGQARYGDWMEKLLYNGIGAALPMHGRGKTFYYADYRLGGGTKVYYPEPWPCCSGTYIQAVADYHNIIYFKDAAGLYVNLFVLSEVSWNCQGEEVRVVQETDYPESDTTLLTVHVKKSTPFALHFRVPAWSRGATLKVNGAQVDVPAQPGTWAAIQRTWNPDDRVTFQIPMRLTLVPVDKQHPYRVAAVYGPVVLVREQEEIVFASPEDRSKWITPAGKQLEFGALARSRGKFVPFYRLGYGTPYCMYFDLQV